MRLDQKHIAEFSAAVNPRLNLSAEIASAIHILRDMAAVMPIAEIDMTIRRRMALGSLVDVIRMVAAFGGQVFDLPHHQMDLAMIPQTAAGVSAGAIVDSPDAVRRWQKRLDEPQSETDH